MARDWGRRLGLAAVAVLAAPLVAHAAVSSPVAITIKDSAGCGSANPNVHCFVPASLTVSDGHSVDWSSQSTARHRIEMDDGSGWESGDIAPGQQNAYPHLFPSGDHPYHCYYHPSMKGVIHVYGTTTTDSSSSDQSSTDSPTTSASTYSFSVSSNPDAPVITPSPTADTTDSSSSSDDTAVADAGNGDALPSTGASTTTDAGGQLTAVASPGGGSGGGHGVLIAFLVLVVLAGGSAAAVWFTRPGRL